MTNKLKDSGITSINSDWIDQLINNTSSDQSNITEEESTARESSAVSFTQINDATKAQLKDFTDLLASLSSTADKKKALWRQIYENAVTDRMNAYLIFTDLYIRVHGKDEKHGLHGLTLTKYLERMSKANDQLLKLAELVASVKSKELETLEGNEKTSDEGLYDKIIKH